VNILNTVFAIHTPLLCDCMTNSKQVNDLMERKVTDTKNLKTTTSTSKLSVRRPTY